MGNRILAPSSPFKGVLEKGCHEVRIDVERDLTGLAPLSSNESIVVGTLVHPRLDGDLYVPIPSIVRELVLEIFIEELDTRVEGGQGWSWFVDTTWAGI
jgi:hypothetical protein